MNEELKKGVRSRLNVLDVVLILLLAFCIVGVWQRDNLKKIFDAEVEATAYRVTFEIKALPLSMAESLVDETVLYFEEDGELSRLAALDGAPTKTPTVAYTVDEEGNTVLVTYPTEGEYARFDLRAAFSCTGVLRESSLVCDTVTLTVGETLQLHTETGRFEVLILSISPID